MNFYGLLLFELFSYLLQNKIKSILTEKRILTCYVSGVKRFVYISAADFGVINNLIRGYFQGKVLSSSSSWLTS